MIRELILYESRNKPDKHECHKLYNYIIKAKLKNSWPRKVTQIQEKMNTLGSGCHGNNYENLVLEVLSEDQSKETKSGLYPIPVLTPNRIKKRQNGRRFKADGDPAFTITTQDLHGVCTYGRIRTLMPIECERLQGFPDNHTEGQSDSRRYMQLGDAVCVPVVKHILEIIMDK